jgi:hypothetical protein
MAHHFVAEDEIKANLSSSNNESNGLAWENFGRLWGGKW